ncbi:hypothetical protein C4F50_09425 [Flavobacterium sp. KB82]|uniref:Phage integrase SAM-like domain-containing protein n=1 Tax=Flavobacterium hungaricum TaxID=2082725 RepID=A0ABR9TKH5_9FLAO|nr:hypothetical protein [Flavobacterium hungaricum]
MQYIREDWEKLFQNTKISGVKTNILFCEILENYKRLFFLFFYREFTNFKAIQKDKICENHFNLPQKKLRSKKENLVLIREFVAN